MSMKDKLHCDNKKTSNTELKTVNQYWFDCINIHIYKNSVCKKHIDVVDADKCEDRIHNLLISVPFFWLQLISCTCGIISLCGAKLPVCSFFFGVFKFQNIQFKVIKKLFRIFFLDTKRKIFRATRCQIANYINDRYQRSLVPNTLEFCHLFDCYLSVCLLHNFLRRQSL